uniref:DNA polymerase n=1 Tax=Lyophyllum semitale TaxID=71895 RepID=A0A8H2S9U7_9AGAR|nr:DNA polymerase [Lyophyllum semitale]
MKTNNKQILYNKWLNYSVEFNNIILNSSDITNSLTQFWNDVMLQIDKNKVILIQFKIKNSVGEYNSISYVQRVENDEYKLNELIKYFHEFWSLKLEDYYMIKVSSIIYKYKILNIDNLKDSKDSKFKISKLNSHKNIIQEKQPSFKFSGFNLPATMDITKWGACHFYNNYKNAIVYKTKSKSEYVISLFDNYQIVELKIENHTIISFKDSMIDANNLTIFKREIKDQEYFFENGSIILKTIKRKTPYLTKVKRSAGRSINFITMDLETRNINGVMNPYCVSIYDGKEIITFYLTDFKDYTEMLESAILTLMKRKYNGYRVYLHNFSNFDGIFLIRVLSKLSDNIKPIIRDNKIIDLKFNFACYTLFFRDSYLLLPSSLEKLAKSFNVDNKSIFPYLFVNDSNISLDYEGPIPSFKYFINISKERYNEYCMNFSDKNWDLREETIKYCNQDVISLYQIISKFSKEIFELFRLDILKYPTLSSLSFAIFRSKFLKDSKIPLITGKIFNDIKKAYTGGIVDVFKPYGENIYHYDINSLYPYIMKNFPMPIGTVKYFDGDITAVEDKPFGIFDVEVNTPKNLNFPLLQTRIKTESGFRTISPLGNWKNTYLSSEIYKAMEYGYSFKILRGYTFDQGFIFTEFVDFLYEIKVKNEKDTPNYTIAKLLLNSLYGRFGMNPEVENHVIIENNKSYEYFNKFVITDVLDLQNGKEILTYLDNKPDNDEYLTMNISIPIAVTVTSLARLYMYQFKTMNNLTLFYTDTDSIDIDKPLNPNLVGKELGKMKLEFLFKKAVFLAPKVYAGIISDDQEKVVVKGLKTSPSFKDLLSLLKKNTKLTIPQDKWYKNISKGNIQIKEEVYNLRVTANKRELVYDEKNNFIDTKPFILQDGKIMNMNK